MKQVKDTLDHCQRPGNLPPEKLTSPAHLERLLAKAKERNQSALDPTIVGLNKSF